jgi:hypothetical protein
MEDLNIHDNITIFKRFSWGQVMQSAIASSLVLICAFLFTKATYMYGNANDVTTIKADVQVLKVENKANNTQYQLIIEEIRGLKSEIANDKQNNEMLQDQRDKKIDLVIDLVKSLLNGRK